MKRSYIRWRWSAKVDCARSLRFIYVSRSKNEEAEANVSSAPMITPGVVA